MKQVFNFGGDIIVEEIDPPICDDNSILVQNLYSAISIGTEKTTVSKKKETSLIKRLLNKENLQKGFEMVKNKGLKQTLKIVKDTGEIFLVPLGYSSAGKVISVGKNVTNFSKGDLIACAGGGFATHAEIVCVPKNLVCKIPMNVSVKEAAFATIGAIALQGVRRSKISIGETVAVIGVGLIGQITCQILSAAGNNVIAIDLLDNRLKIAKNNGADLVLNSANSDIEKEVINYTQSIGADAVIICAGSKTNDLVDLAMRLCRKKGKVVVVGAVGMDLKRDLMYEKELDLLISTSYGPGRYDTKYEIDGQDYPISYVRWTENRNMKAILNLLKKKQLNLNEIIEYELSLEKAPDAYKIIKEQNPLGIVLKYQEAPIDEKKLSRKTEHKLREEITGKLRIGLIGAGSFAHNFHLPNLKKIKECEIEAIIDQNPIVARNSAKKFDVRISGTDYKELFDEKLDLVVITTRHDTHVEISKAFANQGVNILVEKPLALSIKDSEGIAKDVRKNKVQLAVGFNRRFAPLSQLAKKIVNKRKTPLIVNYRINSSGMTKDHWINDPIKGGGAILGEAIHFFDYCNWLVGSEPKDYKAEMISSNNEGIIDSNNIISLIKYEDGSIANVIYTNVGTMEFQKERIEIIYENKVIVIEDFQEIKFFGIKQNNVKLKAIDKGHYQFLEAYVEFLQGKRDSTDIPLLDDGVKATVTTIKIIESAKNNS
ncbi:MAG: zinc-binding dehydrogenase [Asgard group archaeon]|nr:zinc-binding dehydrogenase [Asgard group archaeon]